MKFGSNDWQLSGTTVTSIASRIWLTSTDFVFETLMAIRYSQSEHQ